jgi:hypothetical protein
MLRRSWIFALCVAGFLGSDGQAQTYVYGQSNGNQTFYYGTSNGKPVSGSAYTVGNQTFYSNGVTALRAGNQTFYSNGMTAQSFGTQTIYSGNGVSAQGQRIANQTFISGTSHGVPFSGTAQSFGNQAAYYGTGPTSQQSRTAHPYRQPAVYRGPTQGMPYGGAAPNFSGQGFYYNPGSVGYGQTTGVQQTVPIIGGQRTTGTNGAAAFSYDFAHLPTISNP